MVTQHLENEVSYHCLTGIVHALPISFRFSLNCKGIPYKTTWIEYPDIEAHCKKLGIQAVDTKPDGRPHYTLPAIYDSATGLAIGDSIRIAEYLDEQYPDTPKLIPAGTEALQHTFNYAFSATMRAILPLVLFDVNTRLHPASQEYFARTKGEEVGGCLEKIIPNEKVREEKWRAVQAEFDRLDSWLQKNPSGPFIMGDTISFADCALAGCLLRMRIVWGEDSEGWSKIKSWHDGRWVKFLDVMKPYEAVL